MEIRIILDPNEVRELLAKTGEVVIRPSVSNATIDARHDRRGRPLSNPPTVQVMVEDEAEDEAEEVPAEVAKAKPKAAPKAAPKVDAKTSKVFTQAEIQTALAQFAKKNGRDATKAILEVFGKTVADIKPADYATLMNELSPKPESTDEW